MFQVEKCGRLVEQRNLRLLRQRSRKEHAFALAAGQLLDMTSRQMREVEALERTDRDFEIVTALEAEGAKMRRTSHQYDLQHGEAKSDRVFLSDRSNRAGQLAALEGIERSAEEFDASRRRPH